MRLIAMHSAQLGGGVVRLCGCDLCRQADRELERAMRARGR